APASGQPASMQLKLARALFTARIVWRNFSRGLPIRVMLLQVLVTFCVLLPLLCAGLPHSAYYWPGDLRKTNFHLRNEDERRVAQGNSYIAALKGQRWAYLPDEGAKGPRLAVAVLAVDRNNRRIDAYQPHYLTQTLHSLLASADRDKRLYGGRFRSLQVAVCNAEQQPHRFAEAKRWEQALPVLSRQHPPELPLPVSASAIRCRPKADWAWCLGALAAASPDADWLAVVEDDQLARLDAVSALHDIMDSKLARRYGDQRLARVGLVHLHSPASELRYRWLDAGTWLELMLIGGCIGGACFMLYYRMFCNPMLFLPNLCLASFLFIYSLAVAVAVGRPNWLAARHALTRIYSLDEPLSANFSAVLLPRQSQLLLNGSGGRASPLTGCWGAEQVDAAMRSAGRRVLAVYPSLLRHVGLYSAHSGGLLAPHLLD
ncbi:hypothetical protein BOX15_Mlig002820g1, partial [Macrostomum lignano]